MHRVLSWVMWAAIIMATAVLAVWLLFYIGAQGPVAGDDPCVYHQSGVHLPDCEQ